MLKLCKYISETDVIVVYVSPSDPEAPPRGLNVTATSNGLRIAWEDPAVLSGPTYYLVQVTSLIFVKTLITYRVNCNKYHST